MLIIANTQSVHASDEYTAVMGSVVCTSNLQIHYFSHTTPKKPKIHITEVN